MDKVSGYRQLQPEERVLLAAWRQQRLGVREAARRLGRPPSTVSREWLRNACPELGYASASAQRLCVARRRDRRPPPKLAPGSPLFDIVRTLLDWRWSPEQIACTLRRMWPDQPQRQVSHETIYTAIYAHPKGELRRELIACLRQGRSKRRSRSRGEDRRGQLAQAISIHVRPPEIEDRVMPGHWEGDLIKGAGNRSAIAVLVERSTRLVLLAKMPDGTAASALAAFSAKLSSIAAPLRQTLTYDQGKEMALHAQLSQQTGVRVYFCDPHSPWQRGTCENTNGLLRQYFPKGTDLSVYSQAQLDAVADQLNGRPRATHGYHSPLEVFADMMNKLTATHASIH
jgi:Transposase and inactivated derivatives, IS30 family